MAKVKSALEKTVVLVGQAQCAVAHQRVLSVLEGLTSVSKVKSLLKSNKDALENEDQVLFGTKFEDHLEKTSKVSKKSFEYFDPSTSRNFRQPPPPPPPPLHPKGPGDNQRAYTSRIVEPEVMEVEEDIQDQDIQPQIQPQTQEVSYHFVVSHPSLNMLSEVGINAHQTLKDLFWEIKSERNLAGRLKYYLKNWKKNYKRPIHLKNCKGLGNKILEQASDKTSPSNKHEGRRKNTGLLRNRKHVEEGSNKISVCLSWSNVKQHIPQGEEKRDVSTHNKFEKSEFLHSLPTLQDGRVEQCKRFTSEGRLHGENRPNRCLFFNPAPQELLRFL